MKYRPTVISIKKLSKIYLSYKQPTDRLKQLFVNQKLYTEHHALNEISLDVKKNECLGIIGANGAGKSTLLSIIVGITKPSNGNISTCGRIASLLELGAGFNPEFTGIDNVKLTASIYGLSDKQIKLKIPTIIEFSGIGDFVYKPVRIYSSGMVVRLAFSIIANIDPDILIIDEALSVGDAVFVQKCMSFIRNFKKEKTLIFVSHDLNAIKNLCDKVLWLNNGKIEECGNPKKVVDAYTIFSLKKLHSTDVKKNKINFIDTSKNIKVNYQSDLKINNNESEESFFKPYGLQTEKVKVNNVHLENNGKIILDSVKGGEIVSLIINFTTKIKIKSPVVGFVVKDKLGQDLFGENTAILNTKSANKIDKGMKVTSYFEFKLPMLPNGDYSVTIAIADGNLSKFNTFHHVNNALIFSVFNSKIRFGLVGVEFTKMGISKT